jgi:hypothetical protein
VSRRPISGEDGRGRTGATLTSGRRVRTSVRREGHAQTELRLGPHPAGQHRRSPDLDRHGVLAHNLAKISALAT